MSNSETISHAGDVRIDDVTIITAIGFAQTITPEVLGIEIYEDVFATFITGKIFVKDSQSLTSLLPFIGEEVVSIRVRTPSLPDEAVYDGEFYIYKLDDKMQTQEREMHYVLHFISKEAIVDLNKNVSRAYSGKVSDIAREIITGQDALESIKDVSIEETKNSTKFISNFWSPVKCLQYAADTAVNSNGSPSYVFFENKFGMNFISLETLYTSTPIQQRFKWDNYSNQIDSSGGSRRNISEDYQRVMEFDMPEPFDYIQRLKSGMYGSELIYYNILSQQYVHTSYGPTFDDHDHLNEYPLWSLKVPARRKAVVIHGKQYYNCFEGFADVTNVKTVQMRRSLLAQAEGYKVNITVFGRTDYSAGQRVYLEVPRNGQISESDTDWEDKIMSGTYLVGALVHFITRDKHTCTMQLVKDSYLVNLNDIKQ